MTQQAAEGASPPCPVPGEPPLASAPRNGTAMTISFLNHARYPLKLYFAREGGELAEMGTLLSNGQALT